MFLIFLQNFVQLDQNALDHVEGGHRRFEHFQELRRRWKTSVPFRTGGSAGIS
jgi:hypothetical protein